MKAWYNKYDLTFKNPAQTSRGTFHSRRVWFLFIQDGNRTGIGECAPIDGLSTETHQEVEALLKEICHSPENYVTKPSLLRHIPSVCFALETALKDLQGGGERQLFSTKFSKGQAGILINGLVWMGELSDMKTQVEEKINAGYTCIKLKIGSKNISEELNLIRNIRQIYSSDELTIRVDANGAFNGDQVQDILHQLSNLDVHSIEQPLAPGKYYQLTKFCTRSPIPIALDEELIGIQSTVDKLKLLDTLEPHFLVLKPSLHGGIGGCDEWIKLAEKRNIGWWITSYLESNIGLNAIAQWTASKNTSIHQGLGTGQLYTNNIDSPLEIIGEQLWINNEKSFTIPE